VSRYSPERLYELLPAVYRQRDEELGFPLRDLVADLAEQAMVLEADIARLYESWFIETCDPWVVPYIAGLIGLQGTPPAGLEQRVEVANALDYRRRKGTLAALEGLARDVSGWPARAVEFFELLGATQFLNHLRPHSLRTPDLRQIEPLEHLGGPFETAAHTVDVRRLSRGRYNISNLGIYLWRLKDYPLKGITPRRVDPPPMGPQPHRYTFNVLGFDEPLFTVPATETDRFHLAEEINVPAPIRRRALDARPELFYGQSLEVRAGGQTVPLGKIVACDLTNWQRPIPKEKVAVDPELGRLAFGSDFNPGSVEVRYAYGFSADLGGGPYERQASFTEIADELPIMVGKDGLETALNEWRMKGSKSAVILIPDSRTYNETLTTIRVPPGVRLEIRAKNGQRPFLLLQEPMEIEGQGERSRFELNGLMILGRRVRVTRALGELRVRHCTLVPRKQPVLVVEAGTPSIVLERTIAGRIWTIPQARVEAVDSILDAAEPGAAVYAGPEGAGPGAPLRLTRCTVLHEVHTREMTLAENSILLAPAMADRLQAGCVRFSWVKPGSRLPRRFHCLPEEGGRGPTPCFTALHYGQPGYCQLTAGNPEEIRRLADDESEPGAFSSLLQPLREDYLRRRLEESLRTGLEVGLFFVT
jgi:hypothetical protein